METYHWEVIPQRSYALPAVLQADTPTKIREVILHDPEHTVHEAIQVFSHINVKQRAVYMH